MTADALAKDLAGLKKDLYVVAKQIADGNKELEGLNRARELARADLKNIQTLKDPLIDNYDLRIKQKKKELVDLEADIKAAQITRQDLDEGMAEQIFNGKQAIDNAQKIEHSIRESIKALRLKEDSALQTIANLKTDIDRESSALASLNEAVVSLKQAKETLIAWLKSQEGLVELQQSLEKKEQEINAARDYLAAWEKEILDYEHDLNVMEARVSPKYLEAFGRINSTYINGTHPKRTGLQAKG